MKTREIHCKNCKEKFQLVLETEDSAPEYCTHCGCPITASKALTEGIESSLPSESLVSFIQDLIPKKEEIKFTIGPYQIIRSIGKGGMGEVFLAFDTTCGRRIALKRIRPDLNRIPNIHERFLKEAHITSQLTHPTIIPIYDIHEEKAHSYYTMPFVGGETLKQILRATRQQKNHHLGSSIPALIRVFIHVCQATAYAHTRGVLHRDLKPENIIVGPFGEVLILDWGLAKLIDSIDESGDEDSGIHNALNEITRLGKVVGTVSYMAPERALGGPATLQTEVYALGVILYQLLTLHLPFRRPSLKEFRKKVYKEDLNDPIEVAPYRDIPRVLVGIVKRCLASHVKDRYETVDDLLHELENYIEGRSEWFRIAEFAINNKSDWEFQENVLIAEHIAITRSTEVSDWVNLMISKATFSENTKLEAKVYIKNGSQGIGFLLSIPEPSERVHLNDGYCLWIGTEHHRGTKLLRSTVEVIHDDEVFLQENSWYDIRIEKIDNNLYFYINDELQFSYISYLPLSGTHIGFLARDALYDVDNFFGSVGSQNVTVNCLAIPDAFLAHKDYESALTEYRRIGYSFPGRAEGRDAMFRAGVTLIEQARLSDDPKISEQIYDSALEEFEKLHNTPGAPLEYLGKALVYQQLRDYEEEIKCFELAYRRYPNHPLLSMLEEQIVYRLHESSQYHRKAAYDFILLITRHLPKVADTATAAKLFRNLQKHWEPLNFIEHPGKNAPKTAKRQLFNSELAFWLAKPYVLLEICDELLEADQINAHLIGNILYSLVELGCGELAETHIQRIREKSDQLENTVALIEMAISSRKIGIKSSLNTFFKHVPPKFKVREERILFYLLDQAVLHKDLSLVHDAAQKLESFELTGNGSLWLTYYQCFAYLLEMNLDKAGEILENFPLEVLNQEEIPLHFLYGCFLYLTEGQELALIHFKGGLDLPHPRSWALFNHYLKGKVGENQRWFQHAFSWEKRQLYKQLWLFYTCEGDKEKVNHYHHLIEREM